MAPMMRRPPPTVPEDYDYLRPPLEIDAPRHSDNLFLWTVFLLLLVGFSMACWVGSYVVFAKPELPFSYKLLRKIHKIDAPQKFKVTAAPKGEFQTAEQLYNRWNSLSGPDLRNLNRTLERSYLRNYSAANEMVPYIKGRFTIMDSYELGASDFVTSGAVALAVSTDFPRVLIEHIYSSGAQDAPLIKRNLQPGMEVELRRTYELTAVLHVARLTDGHLQLTVVPINYGRYIFTGANGGFELQPPEMLNVAAGWPIVRGDRLESANQAYLDFRTRAGQGPMVVRNTPGQKPPMTALKGVDLPLEPPAATPPAAGATPPLVGRNRRRSQETRRRHPAGRDAGTDRRAHRSGGGSGAARPAGERRAAPPGGHAGDRAQGDRAQPDGRRRLVATFPRWRDGGGRSAGRCGYGGGAQLAGLCARACAQWTEHPGRRDRLVRPAQFRRGTGVSDRPVRSPRGGREPGTGHQARGDAFEQRRQQGARAGRLPERASRCPPRARKSAATNSALTKSWMSGRWPTAH